MHETISSDMQTMTGVRPLHFLATEVWDAEVTRAEQKLSTADGL